MKVYVILIGEYSERHVVGVAIDEAHRDAILKACAPRNKYDSEPYTETYDTEFWSPMLKNGKLYRVRFDEDGSVAETEELLEDTEHWGSCEHNGVREAGIYFDADEELMFVDVVATDQTSAEKIAIDKRMAYMAERAGI